MDADDHQPFGLWMGRTNTWDVKSDDVLAIAFLVFTPGKYVIQDGGKDRHYLGCLLRGTFEKFGVQAGNGEETCDKAQLMNDKFD